MEPSFERRKDNAEMLIQIKESIEDLKEKVLTIDQRDYVIMAMKREARKEVFMEAIIQKTSISLVWSFIVFIGYLLWHGILQQFWNG